MNKSDSGTSCRCWAVYIILAVAAVHASAAASADCLDRAERFAAEICGQIVTSGSREHFEVTGTVDAEIGGIIRKFFGSATANTGASKSEDKYTNVVREQLANELANLRQCKSEMVRVAVDQACQLPAEPAASKRLDSQRSQIDDLYADEKRLFPIDWRVISDVSFERPPDGWRVGDYSNKETRVLDVDVLEGKYRWSMKFGESFDLKYERWINLPYGPQVEFYAAIDIKLVHSSAPTAIGLIFGKNEGTDFVFRVDSRNQYSLLRYSGEKLSTVIPWRPGRFDVQQASRIAVTVADGRLSLFLDSEPVGDLLLPSDYRGGIFALTVTSEKLATVVVDFDNFVLRGPL